MPEAQLTVNRETLEFLNVEKLYFPKICLICGKPTDNRVNKSIFGNFEWNKGERKDYHLKLSLCKECNDKTYYQKSKELSIVIVPSILGLVGALIFVSLTLSYIMAISIVILSFLIPYLYYRKRASKILHLKKFIKLKTKIPSKSATEDILQLKIPNENYKSYLIQLNLAHNMDLKFIPTS